jgi:L-alanine-DL-glutamate epimerase-like enolase superfamily enzyme
VEAGEFKILKVKLGTEKDREIIQLIRSVTDKPLYVDINQGWRDVNEALDLTCWLNEQNVLLIEQPFKKEDLGSSEWLTERSPIPIIADESVQRFSDIDRVKNSFHGINIKLMKCTGLYEAHRMIQHGRDLGLKIMLGCLTETSCGISAAVQLAGLADYLDLDGNQLIKNDPFEGLTLTEGRIVPSGKEGLGIWLTDELSFTGLAEK